MRYLKTTGGGAGKKCTERRRHLAREMYGTMQEEAHGTEAWWERGGEERCRNIFRFPIGVTVYGE